LGILCRRIRVLRIRKKVRRVGSNLYGLGRDAIINQLCISLNAKGALTAYSILTLNPLNMAITLIATKFGLSKIMVIVILAFVL